MRTGVVRWISLAIAMLGIVAGQVGAAPLPLLGVQQISTGGFTTCAVVGGGVRCWGSNVLGLEGFNGTIYSYFYLSGAPVILQTLSGVSQVTVGGQHMCALIGGGVKCWGFGGYGQTGPNGSGGGSGPVPVDGASAGATSVSAGGLETCAIVNGGALCWGDNYFGQLGNNSVPSGSNGNYSSTPVAVTGLESGVAKIAVGTAPLASESFAGHVCAIVGNVAECWGDNKHGQLGRDTAQTYSTSAAPVSGLPTGVADIASGDEHSCAVVNGAAWCWGSNFAGELGNAGVPAGYPNYSQAPVAVQGLGSGVVAIAASGNHSCALVNNDAAHPVKCWGSNGFGELGNGTAASSATPVNAEFFPALTAANQVTAITVGAWHTCALVVTSGVTRTYCWGDNEAGQLGKDDTPIKRPAPQSVVGISSNATGIATGTDAWHSCAVVNGAAQCWGDNGGGQLGDGLYTDRSIALGVSGLASGVSEIATGGDYSCAVVSGAAKCWGDGYHGVLGNGSQASQKTPAAVSGLAAGVARIAASGNLGSIVTSGGAVSIGGHACAVVSGGVQCWGENVAGDLGNASVAIGSYSTVPVTVAGISGATEVVVSGDTSCALTGGGVLCWGSKVGNANFPSGSASPVAVSGLDTGVGALAAGHSHLCALQNGAVKCWGYNSWGQLGNGDTQGQPQLEPVAVAGLSNVSAITASSMHTCAVVSGGVKCWGSNFSYQLGVTSGYQNCPSFQCTSLPLAVGGLASVVTALGAGSEHTCALLGNGSIQCWGNDFNGQLGDGRFLTAETPQVVNLGETIFRNGLEP